MITYNKLIRDKIPEIIENDGKKANLRILEDDEYKLELLKKIVEESKEVLEAKDSKQELIKEIGDLMEVLDSVIKEFNLNIEDIISLKEKRKEERGGFEKRLFLESVS
jgi:predicted house-cleaning noncanonical NTP pyrophosphatase (MazG superfamily)